MDHFHFLLEMHVPSDWRLKRAEVLGISLNYYWHEAIHIPSGRVDILVTSDENNTPQKCVIYFSTVEDKPFGSIRMEWDSLKGCWTIRSNNVPSLAGGRSFTMRER